MNIFYEESGIFKVATIVQKNDSTYQADTQHGKRVKLKLNHVFFEFENDLNTFLVAAQQEAEQIDIELLWQSVGEEEFTAQQAAEEYFGASVSKLQLAGVLIALYAAPIYFHKKGKGVFKSASAEVLQQALTAIERKAQQEAQINVWCNELVQGHLPQEIMLDLPRILHVPDKQTLTYKAFNKAAENLKMSFYELAKYTNGVSSLAQYLLQGFESKYFPKGTDFVVIDEPIIPDNLPIADVRAFSIDDLSTTEIDDALSVQDLGNGIKRVGIHIAAPTLASQAHSPIEQVAFDRQSTVYIPAHKITMLPENWISAFSLDEGKTPVAVSLYVDVDANFQISNPISRLERIPIETNLRIQQIEPFFNSEMGTGSADKPQFVHHADCLYLLDFAYALQKQRDRFEEPTAPKKYDYGIEFDADGKVQIIQRERGSPIDTLVSEMMILANTTWAKMLHDSNVAGIFRVQPSGRVRMATQSEPHIGMNVAHYAWFTSPLRRACDFINQLQLKSLILPNTAPRFELKDSELFAAMSAFEATYCAYGDFQIQMEAYWSLVWLEQTKTRELIATVLKEDLVRIEGLPLVARATSIPLEIAPKTRVRLTVSEVDSEKQFVALRYLNVVN